VSDATPAQVDAAVIAACVERLQITDDPLFRKLVEIAQRVTASHGDDYNLRQVSAALLHQIYRNHLGSLLCEGCLNINTAILIAATIGSPDVAPPSCAEESITEQPEPTLPTLNDVVAQTILRVTAQTVEREEAARSQPTEIASDHNGDCYACGGRGYHLTHCPEIEALE
jgi:hypothetical protein